MPEDVLSSSSQLLQKSCFLSFVDLVESSNSKEKVANLFSFHISKKQKNALFKGAKVPCPLKVAVNVSSSVKPVLRFMYYVNEPGLTLLMKKTP